MEQNIGLLLKTQITQAGPCVHLPDLLADVNDRKKRTKQVEKSKKVLASCVQQIEAQVNDLLVPHNLELTTQFPHWRLQFKNADETEYILAWATQHYVTAPPLFHSPVDEIKIFITLDPMVRHVLVVLDALHTSVEELKYTQVLENVGLHRRLQWLLRSVSVFDALEYAAWRTAAQVMGADQITKGELVSAKEIIAAVNGAFV